MKRSNQHYTVDGLKVYGPNTASGGQYLLATARTRAGADLIADLMNRVRAQADLLAALEWRPDYRLTEDEWRAWKALIAAAEDLLGTNGDIFHIDERGVDECIGCGRDYTTDDESDEVQFFCPAADCPRNQMRAAIASTKGEENGE